MRIEAKLDDNAARVIRALDNGPQRFFKALERRLFDVGQRGVQYARDRFMRGSSVQRGRGTASKTAVRSGTRLRSYASRVTLPTGPRGKLLFDYGPIRATGGRVPIHTRVHEGFDAQGNQVSEFIIKARNKPFLHFPLRSGVGLSKSNIIGWVRKKEVRLKPRPTFPAMQRWFEPEVQRAINDAAEAVLEG